MKITIGQLKQHVRTALAERKQPAHRALREGERDPMLMEAAQGEFVEAFRNQLFESANASDDPSIEAAGGPAAWEMQVDAAIERFSEELEELMQRTGDDLMNGEFYAPEGATR